MSYLEIHKIAHSLGIQSNITMLFGTYEDPSSLITHLMRVRETQDETGGFKTCVPYPYHAQNNALGKRQHLLKPKDPIRVFAITRLMLDNVRNLKVLWNYLGIDRALNILNCGGNDLGSTAIDEKVITMAGGIKVHMTKNTLCDLIKSINRVPKHIHSGLEETMGVVHA